MAIERLVKALSASESEIKDSLKILDERLKERGVAVIFKDDEVSLRTAPEASELIEKLSKEELTKDLGKAGLETLSIILYQGPISRREIDYVRGVNSNFILRNLLIRGLVEKIDNPKDQRSYLYRPTFDLLSFLGVSRIEDLPEYAPVRKEIEAFGATSPEIETPVLGTDESSPADHQ